MTIIDLQIEDKLGACDTCRGLGTIMQFRVDDGPFNAPSKKGDKFLDIDGEKGWYHGELLVEPCPDCRKYKKREYYRSRCGLDIDELEIRLSDFKAAGEFRDKLQAKEAIGKYAGMGKDAAGFVTIHGNYGVGKSMLGKILVNELIYNDAEAVYINAADLIADIKKNFDADSNRMIAVENAIYQWQSIKALVIDELDKVKTTEYVTEALHRLLDKRYTNRHGILTVIISNTSPDMMPDNLGYLRSRMYAGVIIEVPGRDARIIEGIKARKEMGL